MKREWFRTLKFLLFSASAGIIELVGELLLVEVAGWNYWLAYGVALTASVLWNFTFNRKYTFRSADNVPRAMALVAAYYCVFAPASIFLGDFLKEDLNWNHILVTVLLMAINFVTEFLYQRFVVYRNSVDTNRQAREHQEETHGADF